MFHAQDIANYFLRKDKDGRMFNKKLVHRNSRDFYEGNARLNKYLHLAQNLFLAQTGDLLFEEDLYAYDNGAVVPEVQERYSVLLSKKSEPNLPEYVCTFLDHIYAAFENATLDELIELSHEDNEWIDKNRFYYKSDQRMNSRARASEYKEQYRDFLRVLDRMGNK